MNLKRLFSDRYYLASVFIHIILCIGVLWGVRLQKFQKPPRLSVSLYLEPLHLKSPLLSKGSTPLTTKPPKKIAPPKKKSLASRLSKDKTISTVYKKKYNSLKKIPTQGFLKGNEFTQLRDKRKNFLSKSGDSIREKKILLSPLKLKTLLKQAGGKKDLPLSKIAGSQNINETERINKNVDSVEVTKGGYWIKKKEKRTYKKMLHNRISKNWILPPISQKFSPIKLKLVLTPAGALKFVKFIKKSENAILNISAYQAVKKAAPFPTLPPSFQKDKKNGEFTIHFLPMGD